MKNFLVLIFSLLCLAANAQAPLSISAYKAKVNTQVRTASGALSITKEKIATLYDDLADIVAAQGDTDVLVTITRLNDSLIVLNEYIDAVVAELANINTDSLIDLINLRVRYADSGGFLPTKTFLLNNYFKNGGNTWGATFSYGSVDNRAGRVLVNNVNVLDYFANGDVGIATNGTNPGYKLSVAGTGKYTSALRINTDYSMLSSMLYVNGEGNRTFVGIDGMITLINAASATFNIDMIYGNRAYGNVYGTIGFGNISSPSLSHQSIELKLDTRIGVAPFRIFIRNYDNGAAFDALDIFNDGKVGINTNNTNSGFQLDVNGTFRAQGLARFTTTPEYADNAAAVSGGLAVGTLYRTGDIVKIVH